MYTITGKYIDVRTNNVVGVRITAGSAYLAAVTIEKAKSLGIEDIDIIQYLDVEEVKVHVLPSNRYVIHEKMSWVMSDYETVPYEDMGDMVVVYGDVFEKRYVCQFDVESAISRLSERLEAVV